MPVYTLTSYATVRRWKRLPPSGYIVVDQPMQRLISSQPSSKNKQLDEVERLSSLINHLPPQLASSPACARADESSPLSTTATAIFPGYAIPLLGL